MPRAKRKPKIYLAGPWFTADAKIIHVLAKNIIKSNNNNYEGLFPDEMSTGCDPLETFRNNVLAIEKCDAIIALVDIKDVGTAWEIGMAYKMRKRIILVGISEDTFKSKTNLMLAFTGDAILLQDLEKFLDDPMGFNKYIVRNNDWEGIE